jgi:penicillin-binding protein-related factor A (putative recombinase)
MFKKNTGKALENLIEKQSEFFHAKGLLYLQKVDPPTRTINTRSGKLTTLLPNPFPDFIGCLPSGQMVCIEAKSNQHKSLPFGKQGIRQKQLDDLIKWKSAGAKVGVIWQNLSGYYWVTLECIRKSVANDRKSVPIEFAEKINEEKGYILNFLKYL